MDANDDWASGSEEEGFGDISAIPEVQMPDPPSRPAPPAPANPPKNAWTSAGSNDIRSAPNGFRDSANGIRAPQNDFRAAAGDLRGGPRPRPVQRAAPAGPPAQLHVSNLPPDISEQAIISFFASENVPVLYVRLLRQQESRSPRIAIVTVRPDTFNTGLALNGHELASRVLAIRVDNHPPARQHQQRHQPVPTTHHRPGYGFRDTDRTREQRPGATWTERERSPQQYDNRPFDYRQSGDGRRPQAGNAFPENRPRNPADPTIPTGPPPAGRKKLQLKPRTKPPPKLEVDQRAIGGPVRPAGAGSPPVRNASDARAGRFPAPSRKAASQEQGKDDVTWDEANTAKEQSPRPAANEQAQSSQSKEEDPKRPVLLNTFAALEVNESDM